MSRCRKTPRRKRCSKTPLRARHGRCYRFAGLCGRQFHVQDLSSQLLCAFVSPQPGERLADVCAAPGGKSFTLAEYMENTGVLDAFDLYKGRVNLIKKGAERLGLSIIHAAVRDAATGVCESSTTACCAMCRAPDSGLFDASRKSATKSKRALKSCLRCSSKFWSIPHSLYVRAVCCFIPRARCAMRKTARW